MEKKSLIGALVLLLIFPLVCFSQEELEVQESPDIVTIRKISMNIGVGLMFTCMGELTKEMKENGATDEEIASLFANQAEAEELQKKCLCKYKAEVMDGFKELDTVLLKHPDWKGKVLVIKSAGAMGPSTEKLDVGGFEQIKKIVSTCP